MPYRRLRSDCAYVNKTAKNVVGKRYSIKKFKVTNEGLDLCDEKKRELKSYNNEPEGAKNTEQ